MAEPRNNNKPTSNHSKDVVLSVAPLFYVSKILGIVPFSFTGFNQHLQLRKSPIGVIWCLAVILINSSQYHISLNNSFNQSWGSDTNTLTAVIGIFIVYMEPFMMTTGILINIFYQNLAISCLERVAKVDDQLMAVSSKRGNDKKVRNLALVLIAITVICEIGLILFNFFQFQISDDLFLQSYWWICSGVPIFTDSISRIWYLVMIYLVKLRVEVINEYCGELQKQFKEKKDKYQQMNSKTGPKTTVSIGYLGQEIYDPKLRTQKKVHFPTSNKIHVMPRGTGNNTPIFITEKEMKWMPQNNFIVEDKMDKKLAEIVKIHDELCEIAKVINKICSIPILLTMAYGFMSVTAQLYFLYCGLVGQVIPILFRSAESLTISTIYIIYTSFKCVSIIYISWKTKMETQKTGIHLHKIANVLDENHFYHIVNHLSLKLLNNQLVFTACGFFELDMTTIYAITGAITSYLIILIQFNLAAHKTRTAKMNPANNQTMTNSTIIGTSI